MDSNSCAHPRATGRPINLPICKDDYVLFFYDYFSIVRPIFSLILPKDYSVDVPLTIKLTLVFEHHVFNVSCELDELPSIRRLNRQCILQTHTRLHRN